MDSKVEPRTLSDAETSSRPGASRRALLRMIGIGAAVGAAVVLLPVTSGKAQYVYGGDINNAPRKTSAKKLRTKLPTRPSTKSR